MSLIAKITVFAVAAALLSSFVKETKPEFVVPIQLCAIVIIASIVLNFGAKRIVELFEGELGELLPSSYITAMLKGTCVSLACTLCASLCRESGNKALGDIVETAGRILILVFCIPFIESVLKTAIAYVT